LDGTLDDDCWKNAENPQTSDVSGQSTQTHPTQFHVAYDDHYLYIAAECRHAPGDHVPTVTKRDYDADVHGHDRIEVLLDLDRDYQTYYRLRVDHRGCVADDCWDDPRWNPKWFVAVHSDADRWTLEAAIPFSELTSQVPKDGSTWAINVIRVLPTRGIQAWSHPAGIRPRPEGMGLLRFQSTQE
jgi:hypothetical protein